MHSVNYALSIGMKATGGQRTTSAGMATLPTPTLVS